MAKNVIEYPEKKIALMTSQDYMLNKELFEGCEDMYWLETPGVIEIVFCTTPNGCYMGRYVDEEHLVKPVLILLNSGFSEGDIINFEGYSWTMYKSEKLARNVYNHYFLCNDHIGMSPFNADIKNENSNSFKGSDIERLLQEKFGIENKEIYNPKLELKKKKLLEKREKKAKKLELKVQKQEERQAMKEKKLAEKKKRKDDDDDD